MLVFPGCGGGGADVARFDALRDLPQRLLAQAVLEVVEERHDLVVLLELVVTATTATKQPLHCLVLQLNPSTRIGIDPCYIVQCSNSIATLYLRLIT